MTSTPDQTEAGFIADHQARFGPPFAMAPAPLRFNMAAYALSHARVTPEKIALIAARHPDNATDAESYSFAAVEDAVLRQAAAIRDALPPTDPDPTGVPPRVAIRLRNNAGYAFAYFGAIAAGCVALPLSDQLTGPEAAHIVADSGAALVLHDPDLPLSNAPPAARVIGDAEWRTRVEQASPIGYANTTAETPAFLVYTSGTTAKPKGVLHAHRAAWGRRPMYEGWYGLTPNDRMLHPGAFNWTYTIGTGLTDPWAIGATGMVFTGEKSPDVWPRLFRSHGATLFAAVPGIYRQMLKYADVTPGTLGPLRHGLVSGEHLPDALADAWVQASGRPLYEALGMSEISTYVSANPDHRRRAGFVGPPQPGRRIAVLSGDQSGGSSGEIEPGLADAGSIGRLAVHRSDPGLMLGYWQRPDLTACAYDGDWFCGGDLAQQAADGYIRHEGRNDDLITAGGYRIAPLDVEAVIARHPAISEVAVTQVCVGADIHVVGAFAVLEGDAAQATAADMETTLRNYAAEHLAGYKQPRVWKFIDALPRTANGKIRRAALSKLASK